MHGDFYRLVSILLLFNVIFLNCNFSFHYFESNLSLHTWNCSFFFLFDTRKGESGTALQCVYFSCSCLTGLYLLQRLTMGIPELGSTSECEPISLRKKQLQIVLESGTVLDPLGPKSLCVRQRVAKQILVRPNSIIVATKSVSFTRKLRTLSPAAKLRGFVSNAAGMSKFNNIAYSIKLLN